MNIILSIAVGIIAAYIFAEFKEQKIKRQLVVDVCSVMLRCIDWELKHKRNNYDMGYHQGKAYNSAWMLERLGYIKWLPATKPNYKKIKAHFPNYVIVFYKTLRWNIGNNRSNIVLLDKNLFNRTLDDDRNNPEMSRKLAKEIRNKCK